RPERARSLPKHGPGHRPERPAQLAPEADHGPPRHPPPPRYLMAGSSYGGEIGVTSEVHWRNELGQFAKDVELAGVRGVTAASIRGAHLAAIFAPKKTLFLAGSIEPFAGGLQG